MSGEGESMDADHSNGDAIGAAETKKAGLVARPVAGGSGGEGLPYAPVDWPLPGDKWRWKVGKRITTNGYFCDRFLFPPARFNKSKIPGGRKVISSRVLAEQFVRKEFPGIDVNAFFASFIWKVPSRHAKPEKDSAGKLSSSPYSKLSHLNGHLESGPTPNDGGCKAGNKMCRPRVEARTDFFPVMNCDICCTESGFCHDCCCILCGKTIDWAYGGYSFIRCEAIVESDSQDFICGHVAHMDCALRSFMAGTVGGDISLDAEYYCRRCDNKTDLVPYLKKLLDTSKSLDSRDDVEKILNLGLCLLRGSKKIEAKNLLAHFESIMAKLRGGVGLEELWRLEDSNQTVTTGESHFGNDAIMLGIQNGASHESSFDLMDEVEPLGVNKMVDSEDLKRGFIVSDSRTASLNLENEIDRALQELRKSQELEYRLAEEKLYKQKDHLLGLYQELDFGRSELANPTALTSATNSDSVMTDYVSRVNQIQREEAKLKLMMQIAKGFGQTPKNILKEQYGLQVND